MTKYLSLNCLLIPLLLCTCERAHKISYEQDMQLLEKHTSVIELSNRDGQSRIAVTPELQGRVMTSTAFGIKGASNGWWNRASLEKAPYETRGLGGEDRVWITPLGSQHSFYYQQITPLDEENWQVPAPLSSGVFSLVTKSEEAIELEQRFALTNFIGTNFLLHLKRSILLLNRDHIASKLDVLPADDLPWVGYEASHVLTNLADDSLSLSTGLAGIWSAGMFEGGDQAIVIIPMENAKANAKLLTYMGPLRKDRLWLDDQAVYFKVDGKYRSKIGVPVDQAPNIYGCYDPEQNRLTIVRLLLGEEADHYSNSHPNVQPLPYTNGEAIPIYNNGPMDYQPTEEVSFYELESTSPLKALAPQESLSHTHLMCHFYGSTDELNVMAEPLLGIDLGTLHR